MYGQEGKLKIKKKHRRQDNPCIMCEQPTRDWDYLCRHCREDWFDGVAARESVAARDGRTKDERVPIYLYWSYLFFDNKADVGDRSDINSRIKKAIIDLAQGREDELTSYWNPRKSVHGNPTRFVECVGKPNGSRGGSDGSSIYIFPRRGTWKLLRDLNRAILDICQYHYVRGYERGQRLLVQIARGEVTVDEINERQAKRI